MTQVVLIIEDGDEYLNHLSRFVPGPQYLQAHHGAAALTTLLSAKVDIIYLDMRFDRTPENELMGDHGQVTREHNGDPVRAWRHLRNHQGLYILATLQQYGFGSLPVILAYDFAFEQKRFEHLQRIYPSLRWVSDTVTPEEIRELFESFCA